MTTKSQDRFKILWKIVETYRNDLASLFKLIRAFSATFRTAEPSKRIGHELSRPLSKFKSFISKQV